MVTRWLAWVLVLICTNSCTNSESSLSANGGADSSETTAATSTASQLGSGGASTGCPVGTHEGSNGSCDSSLSWEQMESGVSKRDHHVTFILQSEDQSFLYVADGASWEEPTYSDVWVSLLDEKGVPGTWTETTSDVVSRFGASVVTKDDAAYILGGQARDSVVRGVANSDGSISNWQELESLPEIRFHGTAERVGDHIFLIGGLKYSDATDTLFRSDILDDGSISSWTNISTLPEQRSHHSSIVYNGYMFVFGGVTGQQSLPKDTVFRASVDEEGNVGTWEELDPLPTKMVTQSSFVFNDHVYLVGGLVGVGYGISDAIYRTSIAEDGTLGTWEELEVKLPVARAHVHQTPVWNDRVYSVGGAIDVQSEQHQVTDALQVGLFE